MKNKDNPNIFDVVILLVDDDLHFLMDLCDRLHSLGFKYIITANTLKDALITCNNLVKPYIIITECNIEGKNIEYITKYIKNICSNIKFIVLTDSNKLSDSFKALEYGAVSFIHKSEKHWDSILFDSLKTWLNYYISKDHITVRLEKSFKQTHYAAII